MNINRDYLVTVDVKKSTITNKQSMFFYVLDENTCNIFVQLVFNESNNEIIQKYSAIENAEDYQLEMNIVLADNSCTKLRGHLHNKEEAIFEFEVPNQFVGNYNCELLTSTTINNKKEVITSNKFTYKVKKSVLNDLEEIKDDVQGEPILPRLQADMAQLTEDMAQFTEDIELRAEQLEEDMSLKAEKEHTHNQYLTNQNISHLAPIDNPRFTNSISLGRKEGMSIGTNSTALGKDTFASGENSFAEGAYTEATGYASHAEGSATKASAIASHAEGFNTEAKGVYSHAEGQMTVASGSHSHAEGYYTTASSVYQHVEGTFNVEDKRNNYIHIAGNGYNASNRSNAHTLDWDGNAWFAGTVKIGAGNKELATKEYVDSKQQDMTQGNVKLDGYATEDYVDEAIADLVNSAPEAMNTFKELADAIEQHEDVYEAYVQEVSIQLANKAEKEHTHSQYLTQHQDLSAYATKSYVTSEIAKAQLEGEEVDLSGFATKTELENKADKEHTHEEYLTEHQDLSDYALKSELPTDYLTSVPSEYITETELEEKNYLTEHQSLEDYALKSELPTVPTKVSQLENDANYLTQHQSLEDYATQEYVDEAIANAELGGEEVDLSNYITKDDITIIGDINSEEVHILKASEIEADISKVVLLNNVQIADAIFMNEIVQLDAWLNEDDKKYITITSLYGYCTDFIENDNDEFDIQFENSYAWQSDLSDNYATKEELNEAISNIEIDVDLSEYAKKEQFTTVENNTLTTDKYQYINITTDTIINLPSVTEFTEIHLYFNTADDFASAITLSATAQIRYQAELVFEASNCYEIIATYVPGCHWLVGAVKYEGLVSQASGGAVNPPNVVDPFA